MYMERWSILSDIVKNVWYNQHPTGHCGLEVKAPEERYSIKIYKNYRLEREVKDISFYLNYKRLAQDYLDIFEGVMSDVICAAKYDEKSELGITYLRTPKMRRQDRCRKAEHKAPIMEDCYKPMNVLFLFCILWSSSKG